MRHKLTPESTHQLRYADSRPESVVTQDFELDQVGKEIKADSSVTSESNRVSDSSLASVMRDLQRDPAGSNSSRTSYTTEARRPQSEDFGDGCQSNPGSDGDIMSVASDPREIASQASANVTRQQEKAEKLISTTLAGNDQLSTLYQNALAKMSSQRLQRNLRRLLKQYYIDLLPLAEYNLRRATVNIFRSRAGRTRISRQIIDSLEQESTKSGNSFKGLLEDKKAFLEG